METNFTTQRKQQKYTLLLLMLLSFLAQPLLAQDPVSKLWDRAYGGNGDDWLYDVVATSDGGALIGGTSNSDAGGSKTVGTRGGRDFWVLKLNADGSKAWDKTFGGAADDWLYSVVTTNDGGYLLVGDSESGISGDKTAASNGAFDYWVVKIDANGNKLWDRAYGGSGDDEFPAVIKTGDGGYLLGGDSNSGVSGDKTEAARGEEDFWIVKIDANGNKVWDKTFGGSGDEELYSLLRTTDGFLVSGASASGISGDKTEASKGDYDYWVVRINADGTKVWDRGYGGSGDDRLRSVTMAVNDGFLLGGGSNSGISGDKTEASKGAYDYWVVRINADGTKVWDKGFGGSGDDFLTSHIVTSDEGYLLLGHSSSGISGDKTEASRGEFDYWLVKMSAEGNKLWDRRFGGANDETSVAIVTTTTDGNYLLGGDSNSGASGDKTQVSNGEYDYWVVKLSSGALSAALPEENVPQLRVYPNPTKGDFNLSFEKLPGVHGAMQLTLTNSAGQVVSQQMVGADQLHSGIKVSMAGLAEGMYFLQLNIAGNVISRKVVLQN